MSRADTGIGMPEAVHRQPAPGERPFPKAPVLGWDYLQSSRQPSIPCVADLPHRVYTTSGRAALLAALRQLLLPAGSIVLLPTYHCPTMVAPVVEAGLTPRFYAIDDTGAPLLEEQGPGGARAIIVAHYFGLTRSLAPVAAWCDLHGVALIEDCAHAYFGLAGERPVGHWGQYATASLSKFFPVPEAGLLASASHRLRPLGLQRPPLRRQFKAAWDVVDWSRRHRRLFGLSHVADAVRGWRAEPPPDPVARHEALSDADIMAGCDMGRVLDRPTWVACALHRHLPAERIVERRRANFARFLDAFSGKGPVRGLVQALPEATAPYVFPLWIQSESHADAVYERLRLARMPVFRWDRHWPGTPKLTGDLGGAWSRCVLQLLCHQDLGPNDIDRVVQSLHHALHAKAP